MSLNQIFAEQYKKLPILTDSQTCTGRIYVITGGNTGIGLETARHLVTSNAAQVVISTRNLAAGAAAQADVERTTGRTGIVDVWQLDLTSFASVKAFAERAVKELGRIDGLVNNAGVFLDQFTLAEGNETSMTVNVISTFLLTVLLMPQLKDTARRHDVRTHVVFVGSALAFQARGELAKGGRTEILKNLNNANEASIGQRYSLTKLVQVYAYRELAKLYPSSAPV